MFRAIKTHPGVFKTPESDTVEAFEGFLGRLLTRGEQPPSPNKDTTRNPYRGDYARWYTLMSGLTFRVFAFKSSVGRDPVLYDNLDPSNTEVEGVFTSPEEYVDGFHRKFIDARRDTPFYVIRTAWLDIFRDGNAFGDELMDYIEGLEHSRGDDWDEARRDPMTGVMTILRRYPPLMRYFDTNTSTFRLPTKRDPLNRLFSSQERTVPRHNYNDTSTYIKDTIYTYRSGIKRPKEFGDGLVNDELDSLIARVARSCPDHTRVTGVGRVGMSYVRFIAEDIAGEPGSGRIVDLFDYQEHHVNPT